jgi:uncharacterized protein
MNKPMPIYNIVYEGQDVGKDFAPILKQVEFKEYLEGKAAELTLDFDNKDGNFFNDWYPAADDTIMVKMGLEGGDLIDCGLFYVDDVALAGSRGGDTCSIKGMSAKGSSIHSDVQKVNREGESIQTIVNQIASSLGYTSKGDLSGTWTGVQNATGLQFLQQLAKETGRIMKVEGTELIFYKLSSIQNGAIVATINKADVKDYNITDQAKGRIAKVTVKSWDPAKKQTVESTHETGVAGGGSQTIYTNAADTNAASSRAEAAATDANKKGTTFDITVPGDVRLRVGIRITTKGWGRFDRTWYAAEATHTVSKSSGYLTKLTLQE